jgi:hypothetical protein
VVAIKIRINWEKLIYWFVLVTLIIATVSVVVMITLAPVENTTGSLDERIKSDYVLMLLQCIFGIFAMFLPALLEKKMEFDNSFKYDDSLHNISILRYLFR